MLFSTIEAADKKWSNACFLPYCLLKLVQCSRISWFEVLKKVKSYQMQFKQQVLVNKAKILFLIVSHTMATSIQKWFTYTGKTEDTELFH